MNLQRDELVSIITDFYVFLTSFYIPSSALKFPPPGGWPNITEETTRNSNKAPVVIDLIKHLPYIEDDDCGYKSGFVRYIHYKSVVVDYSVYTPEQFEEGDLGQGEEGLQIWAEELEAEKAEAGDDDQEEEEDDEDDEQGDNDNYAQSQHSNDSGVSDLSFAEEEEPFWEDDDEDYEIKLRNLIVLALGHESGGRTLILDVRKCEIHEDIVRFMNVSPVPVRKFFDDLREDFEKLILVPTPEEIEEAEDGNTGDDTQEYIDIWKECGWPGEGFKKEEALVKIKECHVRENLRCDERMRLEAEERERERAMEKTV
ncbi:hypothetical protein HBH98_228760 [Parastagonospora nodorum]|nr:hypothetical protein HBI10_220580 [Parastagonospora nodorum]KAH4009045.1 hypothetical protein HBI13_226630 [Parastagonospora nodorum]KAH4336487.1 hypothetical protein HBH98_228760 [Parastagonospora nodorum]KAH4358473.1 hypothetical protein HBH97_217160 [Parastagonospora nodorum]KAH4373444.1 hypothetical protein HBH99_228420 [Parastagonospora nodorum]